MAAAVDEQHQRRWSAMGLAMIAPDDGVRMLRDVIYSGQRPQLAAVPLVRSRMPKDVPPFFSEIVLAETDRKSSGAAPGDVRRRLIEESPDGRAALVTEYLAAQLTRILALGSTHKFDPRRSIVELGMDSLMAMELRNRLLTGMDVRISVTDLLEGPSTQELSMRILELIALQDEGAALNDSNRDVVKL